VRVVRSGESPWSLIWTWNMGFVTDFILNSHETLAVFTYSVFKIREVNTGVLRARKLEIQRINDKFSHT